MNLLFYIGSSPFPYGSAGATRVRALGRALADMGVSVRVISLDVLKDRREDCINGERSFAGISYESVVGYGSAVKHSALFEKLFLYGKILGSSYKGYIRMKKIFTEEDIDVIIFYGWNSLEHEPVIRLANSLGITTICDVVEWPTIKSFRGGFMNPLYWSAKRMWGTSHYLANGVIAISSFIEEQYKNKGIHSIRIPALTDLKPSEKKTHLEKKHDSLNGFRLMYLGKMALKDDPDVMLDAVGMAARQGAPIHFDIIGTDGKSGPAKKYRARCEADQFLYQTVTFHGWVSEEGLAEFLRRAHAVLLLRQENVETKASFPTRLPEFLISGVPVITSAVGDVTDYIKDRESAVVILPGDVVSLANHLVLYSKNPEALVKLGEGGCKVGRERFSNKDHAVRLKEFITELESDKRA